MEGARERGLTLELPNLGVDDTGVAGLVTGAGAGATVAASTAGALASGCAISGWGIG